jgi:tetrapyrrole methylase family protein/MazG family protein
MMGVSYDYKEKYGIDDLLEIMRILRGEGGCPWDREQTHASMRKDMLEEAYEVCEAIDLEDRDLLKEELGDVLLQVVHHARIEEEQGSFNFDDVCDGICKKLIIRHPHVFGDVSVSSTGEVLQNWEQIKQETKGQTTKTQTLQSVPKTFPALMRAQKVQKRAAKTGFDYPDLYWAMGDLESELDELQCAIEDEDPQQCFEELGDVLFSAVNMARFLKVDAEESLNASTEKFISRFQRVEQLAKEQGISLEEISIQDMDKLWKQAKQK